MHYRHSMHAGNHGDVVKHLVLSRLLRHAPRGAAGLIYVDSHAGCGLYDLADGHDAADGEWTRGIGRLWHAVDVPDSCQDYLTCVRDLNPDGALRYYPGSPEVARRLTGPQDSLILYENHPDDGERLRDNYREDRRVTAVVADSWQFAGAHAAASPQRVLLLVDPPYVAADDPERAVAMMRGAVRAAAGTTVAIWYPIEEERDLTTFHRSLRHSGLPNLHCVELWVKSVAAGQGLSGSGLAIANAPEPVITELIELLPWLADLLDQGDAGWSLRTVPVGQG